MNFRHHTLVLLLVVLLPAAARAQFSTTFDTVGSEWIVNRYAPAGFSSASFLGDQRLQLTISSADSAANRPVAFSDAFYNTQGREHAVSLATSWTLSADLYVASSFNTTTGPLARSDLWGVTSAAYMIFGFTNASPTDGFNPAATDRSFRFRAFNLVSGAWIDLGVPSGFTFDAWHTLTATSTGTAFEYRLDGQLLVSQSITGNTALTSAQLQGYNFGQAGSYSVYWDNLSATAIPEPATTALLGALAALGLAVWRRRRV
jgi:hypothetical protein